jgi:hypothetical protein
VQQLPGRDAYLDGLLERCMAATVGTRDKVEADRSGFRPFGPNPMADAPGS